MIMNLSSLTSKGGFASTSDDIEGFKFKNRVIVLSEISSSTIPDIMDLVFNLLPGGSGSFVSGLERKTKVVVINNSEVYGDFRGTKNTRTRNAIIHYGFSDVPIDQINMESPITFTNLDYNIICDKPWDAESNPTAFALQEVQVSYDERSTGGLIYRDTKSYNPILIPDPIHYDEKDQVLLTDNDQDSYYDNMKINIMENKFDNPSHYLSQLFTCTLGDLYDKHTKIFKLNIKIDRLTHCQIIDGVDDFNDWVQDVVSQGKYILETCGFSGCELILGGENGFNVDRLITHMDLTKDEICIVRHLLIERLSELNDVVADECRGLGIKIIVRYAYSDVKVVIMGNDLFIGDGEPIVNKTSELTSDLGEKLKLDNMHSLY